MFSDLAWVVVSVAALVQTPAPRHTGVIFGRVVDAMTNAPLTNVRVRIGAESGPTQIVAATTDGDGHFVFSGLPPNRYWLTGTKGGYLDSEFGQRRPGDDPQPVTIGDAAARADITCTHVATGGDHRIGHR